MNADTLRAYSWSRQGLDGSLKGKSSREALLKAGWARSVGGANPYVTIHSRTGVSRQQIDNDVATAEIHELPSARGCTYVVPRDHYALALLLSRGEKESQDIVTAKRFLGVTDAELAKLSEAVLRSLEQGAMDPKQIKDAVGDAARSLGEEGKKRGSTSTLPMVLGQLQTHGEIRRIPQNGRLDQQRYKYQIWKPNPLASNSMIYSEALTEIGKLYFGWIGPASVAHYQWFTGTSGKVAKEALSPLGLVPIEEGCDLLMLPTDLEGLHSFRSPTEPHFNLVASLDSMILLRREVKSLLAQEDIGRDSATDKALVPIGSVQDLSCNAILDRGRLVGLWEYEPSSESIVWTSFVGRSSELNKAVQETEIWIREQLGDCRSFSLDSPESRAPKISMLRELEAAEKTLA